VQRLAQRIGRRPDVGGVDGPVHGPGRHEGHNLLEHVLGGELRLPGGQVPTPVVDADDIAEVAVAALTDDRHVGQLYELTGPRSLTSPRRPPRCVRRGAFSAHATHEAMPAWRQMAAHQAQAPAAHEPAGSDAGPSGPPTGVAVFAADTTIRSLLDPGHTMHWSEFDRGGHFPAMEVPDLLTGDLREFFRGLR
jgi:hypothetical protein